MNDNQKVFYKIYQDLIAQGKIVYPRGLKVLEIENYNYILPPYCRFVNFDDRKLNIDYIKREFLWYLKGQAKDVSIAEHAKIWKPLIKKDGTINSNYGRYVFGELQQYDNVVKILTDDQDSRKASIVILTPTHLMSDDKDTPCTYSLNFRIRDNKLNMTVRMRSQDGIFGMGNDAPAFSFIHEMMFNTLNDIYPELVLGDYYHSCDSFHVYETHFDMLQNIIVNNTYKHYDCPRISGSNEVEFLRKMDFKKIPAIYEFTRWLNL